MIIRVHVQIGQAELLQAELLVAHNSSKPAYFSMFIPVSADSVDDGPASQNNALKTLEE